MSGMPERIWATKPHPMQHSSVWYDEPSAQSHHYPRIEYLRADIAATALAEKDARIAELEAALRTGKDCLVQMAANAFHARLEGTREWDRVAGKADLYGALDAIRAALGESEP